MSTTTTARATPEVAALMRRIWELFPEMHRPLKEPGRSRELHDEIARTVALSVSRTRPTIEQAVAMVMDAGYHVTTHPVSLSPEMRRRAPGTDTAPSADAALHYVKEGSQRGRLLVAYAVAGPEGLTDEEARVKAGISPQSCWWSRCYELRHAGLIRVMVDEHDMPITRPGTSGVQRAVCVITPEGHGAVASFG